MAYCKMLLLRNNKAFGVIMSSFFGSKHDNRDAVLRIATKIINVDKLIEIESI